MVRFLFCILTFSFLLQSTGASSMLKKSVTQTEECSDNTQKGEGKDKKESKSDEEKISHLYVLFLNISLDLFCDLENNNHFAKGFYSKPFLPPRLLN